MNTSADEKFVVEKRSVYVRRRLAHLVRRWIVKLSGDCIIASGAGRVKCTWSCRFTTRRQVLGPRRYTSPRTSFITLHPAQVGGCSLANLHICCIPRWHSGVLRFELDDCQTCGVKVVLSLAPSDPALGTRLLEHLQLAEHKEERQ